MLPIFFICFWNCDTYFLHHRPYPVQFDPLRPVEPHRPRLPENQLLLWHCKNQGKQGDPKRKRNEENNTKN